MTISANIKGIVIGGASRAGKTILAQRVAKHFQISRIPGDSFITSFETAFPQLSIGHMLPHSVTSANIAPFFNNFWRTATYDEDGLSFVFDTAHLRPDGIDFKALKGRVAFVFLGHPDITPQDMLIRVRANKSANEWTHKHTDTDLLEWFSWFIDVSKEIKAQCSSYGLPFFNSGTDFWGAHEEAFSYILDLMDRRASP
jgi:2-phosphoglycerate kinase